MNCSYCGKEMHPRGTASLWGTCADCGEEVSYHFLCGPRDWRQVRCASHREQSGSSTTTTTATAAAAAAAAPTATTTTTTSVRRTTRSSTRGAASVTFSSSRSLQTLSLPRLRASVGFEWQSGVLIYASGGRNRLASKATAFSAAGVFAESDGGELEIVTDPLMYTGALLGPSARSFRTWRLAAVAQIAALQQLIKAVLAVGIKSGRAFTLPAQRLTGLADLQGSACSLGTCGREFERGRMQATIGVPLARLLELFHPKHTWPALSDVMSARDISQLHMNALAMPDATAELRAFILLVEMYINWLSSHLYSTDSDGPKAALHLMCRCSFRSIFTTCLSSSDQSEFQSYVSSRSGGATALLPYGYTVSEFDNVPADYGPTVEEWLASILAPLAAWKIYYQRLQTLPTASGFGAKWHLDRPGCYLSERTNYDLLSPPPFFPTHDSDEVFTYAMGRDRPVGGFVLFEIRGFGGYARHEIAERMMEFCYFAFHGIIGGKLLGTSVDLLGTYDAPPPAYDDIHRFTIRCEATDGHGGNYVASFSLGGGDCFYDSFRRLRLDLGKTVQELRTMTADQLHGTVTTGAEADIRDNADAGTPEMNALGVLTKTLIVVHSFAWGSWDREVQHSHRGVTDGSETHTIHIVHLMGGGGGHYQPLERVT